MSKQWEKLTIIAIKILVVSILCGIVALILYLLPKAISMLAPFIIGAIIALVAAPLTRLFNRIKIPKSFSAIISILIVFFVLGGIIGFLAYRLGEEIMVFANNFPSFYENAQRYLSEWMADIREFIHLLPNSYIESINLFFEAAFTQLGQGLNEFLSKIIEFITRFAITRAKNIPQILVGAIVAILSAFFFLSDKEKITDFVHKNVGEKLYLKIISVKNDTFSALTGYIRAQLILMLITAVELFVGLSILKVEYALLLACFISIIDAIPILGTGTILIPWAIISLIMKNFRLGLGLLILYGVCLLVRQLLEPRILSSQIGMYPLITLFAMYTGLYLFGFFGMIFGPILAVIIKNIITAARSAKNVNVSEEL